MDKFNNIFKQEINQFLKFFTGIEIDFDLEINTDYVQAYCNPALNKHVFVNLTATDANIEFVGFSREYLNNFNYADFKRCWCNKVLKNCETKEQRVYKKILLDQTLKNKCSDTMTI